MSVHFNLAFECITVLKVHFWKFLMTWGLNSDAGLCAVLLDFIAAFDTVDNGMPINRLENWVGVTYTVSLN